MDKDLHRERRIRKKILEKGLFLEITIVVYLEVSTEEGTWNGRPQYLYLLKRP